MHGCKLHVRVLNHLLQYTWNLYMNVKCKIYISDCIYIFLNSNIVVWTRLFSKRSGSTTLTICKCGAGFSHVYISNKMRSEKSIIMSHFTRNWTTFSSDSWAHTPKYWENRQIIMANHGGVVLTLLSIMNLERDQQIVILNGFYKD